MLYMLLLFNALSLLLHFSDFGVDFVTECDVD